MPIKCDQNDPIAPPCHKNKQDDELKNESIHGIFIVQEIK